LKNVLKRLPLISLMLLTVTACSVDSADIETWKGTQNGPKKIAGVLIDPAMPIDLRAEASLALMDINRTDLFIESFRKMDAADADGVILHAAPLFSSAVNPAKNNPGSAETALTPKQVHAKDGLYLMLDFAAKASRPIVEKELISWCVQGNYKVRAMAGYNIRIIAKKIGAPAAAALARLLTTEQPASRTIAELIREIGDAKALEDASTIIAASLRATPTAITSTHLEAAAIIGGAPVADVLLGYATDVKTGIELQRLALRAYSVGLEKKVIPGSETDLQRLIAVANNTEFDRIHREETWMTISQIPLPAAANAIAELLSSPELFFRLVGSRLLLRVDPDTWTPKILRTPDLVRSPSEVEDFIDLFCRFPRIAPALATLVKDRNLMARGFAISVLGVIGTKSQLPALEAVSADISSNNSPLPEGFSGKTTAEAARAAIDAIQKKG